MEKIIIKEKVDIFQVDESIIFLQREPESLFVHGDQRRDRAGGCPGRGCPHLPVPWGQAPGAQILLAGAP